MPHKRAEGTRAPNGASTIYYSEYDGCWHGRVTVGVKDDGRPDRRHVKRKATSEDDKKAYNEVLEAVRKLERDREEGRIRNPGRAWTVEKWLTHWVETIAAPSLRYKAAASYRSAVYVHLIPNLGAHRIDRVEPERFEKLYAKLIAEKGLKATSVGQIHRTAITAFGEAVRRGHLLKNPVALAKPPKAEEAEVEPFSEEEVKRTISAALTERNGVRFVLALALGTRQGETIGLKWSRLDTRTRTLRITRQLQRQTWQHGCADPHECGRNLHKVQPCPSDCTRHKRACSPPCPPECTSHARSCPQRRGGGLVEVDVKSSAGRRGVVLPEPLYELLMEHKAQQDREREHAGTEWHEGGWMFAQENGRPIDPRRDGRDWKALLTRAGVRDARLHDARHTAATVLLLLGVPERAVMGFMGWSNAAMAKRYQHITAALRQDIASRIGGYFWKSN